MADAVSEVYILVSGYAAHDAKKLLRKVYTTMGGDEFQAANLVDEIESPAAGCDERFWIRVASDGG